jgi:hypothetical protein
MDEFPYYRLSWFVYLIVAATFLMFCAWHSRNWSVWARIPVLTFIAALALTPGVTISGENWWSPAAIIMIFEIDQKGFVGIIRSGISIVMVWVVFMISTITFRWSADKWRFNKKNKSQDLPIDDTLSKDKHKQVELIDPEQ